MRLRLRAIEAEFVSELSFTVVVDHLETGNYIGSNPELARLCLCIAYI